MNGACGRSGTLSERLPTALWDTQPIFREQFGQVPGHRGGFNCGGTVPLPAGSGFG
jgi:hypothetical protein